MHKINWSYFHDEITKIAIHLDIHEERMMLNHKALFVWEDKSVNNREISRLPTFWLSCRLSDSVADVLTRLPTFWLVCWWLSTVIWMHSDDLFRVPYMCTRLAHLLTHLPWTKWTPFFADNIFKYISMNEKCCISIWISLKIVPKGPIDNTWALVQVMAWIQIDDKPLTESMLIQFTDAYITPGTLMTSAAADVINDNQCKIG